MLIHAIFVILGLGTIFLTLVDAFVTIVLPRSIQRSWGFSSLFYRFSWSMYHPLMVRLRPGRLRNRLLVSYPPFSVIFLIGFWATLLVLGFALFFFGVSLALNAHPHADFGDYLYFSGVTFFTLGYGDLTPVTAPGRAMAVAESATGFAFLAIIIGYVPVLYGAVSRREIGIVMLDSKAGSDPTAGELLFRYADAGVLPELTGLLADWERWAAEMLESFLAYPMVAYYRSQHDEQSWLQALTAIMDTCAFVEAFLPSEEPWQRSLRFQAKSTFAISRHVIVDLSYIIDQAPLAKLPLRLSDEMRDLMVSRLTRAGLPLVCNKDSCAHFVELRRTYEPFVAALAVDMLLTLPEWIHPNPTLDNWQTSAWDEGSVAHF
jgi:hypothetical protein